jgi:hypothetical protein
MEVEILPKVSFKIQSQYFFRTQFIMYLPFYIYRWVTLWECEQPNSYNSLMTSSARLKMHSRSYKAKIMEETVYLMQ